jgi:hypothetical protein
MGHKVIYPHESSFYGKLAILTIREHLCGYYQELVICVDAGTYVDTDTGHRVCSGCGKVPVAEGLSYCDIGAHEFINLNRVYNNADEIVCPKHIKEYGLEDVCQ